MKIPFCIFLRSYLKKKKSFKHVLFFAPFHPILLFLEFPPYSPSNSSAISIAYCFLSPKTPYTTGVCYRNSKTTFFLSVIPYDVSTENLKNMIIKDIAIPYLECERKKKILMCHPSPNHLLSSYRSIKVRASENFLPSGFTISNNYEAEFVFRFFFVLFSPTYFTRISKYIMVLSRRG